MVKRSPGGLWSRKAEGSETRRRQAPRVEETSDTRRFRGLGWGIVVAAIVATVAAIWAIGPSSLRSPGPLARPHVEANLKCDNCHKAEPATAACAGCHGSHVSMRAAHRDLSSRGVMTCQTCHQIHRGNSGVAFLPDGEVLSYSPGSQVRVVATAHPRARNEVRVPLVSATACTQCHRLSDGRDPASLCISRGVSLCFGEHRAVAEAAHPGSVHAIGTDRDAALASARALVSGGAISAPRRGSRSSPYAAGGVALGGLAAGLLLVWAFRRRGRTAPKARQQAPVLAAPKVVRLPQIDTNTCLGCYACVDACPYDVLEIRSYVATVARPDDCCGLTLCEQRCPNGSLVITEGKPIEDRPRVDEHLQSLDSPGIYVAGDLTGLPLIRNAINQGAHAVRHVAEAASKGVVSKDEQQLDLLIVGAGPAGISAALEAKSLGLDYVVLEQATAADSIRSFPRGKLVFDQPLGMPLIGDLWLKESTKEELLANWVRVIREQRLPINEGERVTTVQRSDSGFTICSQHDDGVKEYSAKAGAGQARKPAEARCADRGKSAVSCSLQLGRRTDLPRPAGRSGRAW